MKNVVSALLDWVCPPACIACRTLLPLNAPRRFLCAACQNLFEPIAAPFCKQCGVPGMSEPKSCASCFSKKFYFAHNRASFTYDELMRDLLHDMKFRGKKRVAQGLGLLWAECLRKNSENLAENFKNYSFIPMPLHPKKQRERGFNQAEILTLPLSDFFQIPILSALIRNIDTPPQAGLHPSQRAENVKNVFSLRKGQEVCGKKFILTDDIFTTGASLNECAKTLKYAGAAQVLCMTLVVAVKNNNKT